MCAKGITEYTHNQSGKTKKPLANAQTLKRARTPPICAKSKGGFSSFHAG